MPTSPLHNELDCPFTLREMGVSLIYAITGVITIAFAVNIWPLSGYLL